MKKIIGIIALALVCSLSAMAQTTDVNLLVRMRNMQPWISNQGREGVQ